jgi:hypothetical protein
LALVADRDGWQVIASTSLTPAPTSAPTSKLVVLNDKKKKKSTDDDTGKNSVVGAVLSAVVGLMVVGGAGLMVFKTRSAAVSPGR